MLRSAPGEQHARRGVARRAALSVTRCAELLQLILALLLVATPLSCDAVTSQSTALPAAKPVPRASLSGCTDGKWMLVDPATLADTTAEGFGVLLVCVSGQFVLACASGGPDPAAAFQEGHAQSFCQTLNQVDLQAAYYLGLGPETHPDLLPTIPGRAGLRCDAPAGGWGCDVVADGTCDPSTHAVNVVCGKIDRPVSIDAVRWCATEEERHFRLVNTRDHLLHAGRVEVCHGGYWGSLSANAPDLQTAHFVCRQLGYPNGAFWHASLAIYGGMRGGVDPTWLDLRCPARATSLLQCSHAGWGVPTFQHTHANDWSVACTPDNRGAELLPSQCDAASRGRVRLVDPRDARLDTTHLGYGVVEYCDGADFGYACDAEIVGAGNAWFGSTVCRQLGFSSSVAHAAPVAATSATPRARAISRAIEANDPSNPAYQGLKDLDFTLPAVDCYGTPISLEECWRPAASTRAICEGGTPMAVTCLDTQVQLAAPLSGLWSEPVCPLAEFGRMRPERPTLKAPAGTSLPEAHTLTGCWSGRRVAMCSPLQPPVWDATPQPYLDDSCANFASADGGLESGIRLGSHDELGGTPDATFRQGRFWMFCPPNDGVSALSDWSLTDCVFLLRGEVPAALQDQCAELEQAAIHCSPPLPPLGSTACASDDGIMFRDAQDQICTSQRSDIVRRIQRAEALAEALLRVSLSSNAHFDVAVAELRNAGLLDEEIDARWPQEPEVGGDAL